jgi:spermidine synthase
MTTVTKRSAQGRISILRDRRTGTVIYRQGRAHQSEADAEGVSISSYVHALYGLIRQARGRDALLIGCGGGTLATMLRRVGIAVTVVDIDPAAFALARRYFNLPEDVTCHVADGVKFLAESKDRWDAIVLDAYIGNNVPPQFLRPPFFELARERLRRGGCLFANAYVLTKNDLKADRLAELMARAFAEVRLLDERDATNRNAIIMAGMSAGKVGRFKPPTMLMKPKSELEDIEATLARMAFRPWRSRPRP